MNRIWKILKTFARMVVALGAAMSAPVALAAPMITYYHNDLAGSPVVATNASAQVIWRESYRPYGERLTNAPASAPNDIWFTSRRQDAETGLVYMGARYYDPVVGRFYSTDPAGFVEGNVHSFNRYSYANNNPYRFLDPDGQQAATIVPALGALVIGGGFAALPRERQAQVLEAVAALSRYTLYGQLGSLIFKDQENPESKGAQESGEQETGSYTNTHESGKRYHGKGDKARSQESGKEKEEKNGDPHIATDWTRAPDERQAFVDEARRIRNDGGVKNPDNYNKINSPGKKYLDD